MKLAARSIAGSFALLMCAAALAACDDSAPKPTYNEEGYVNVLSVPDCDPSIVVKADSPALIVTDPEALKGLTFEAVLTQVIQWSNDYGTSPVDLAARLFDSNNNELAGQFYSGYHCDSPGNPAHVNGKAAECPRAEGALAVSDGFFTEGSKDYFKPVAVVNRFDLASFGGNTCGEARIVFAKQSGLTDANDRVFVIFEVSVPNPQPGNLLGCRDVQKFWKGLEDAGSPADVGAKLQTFFFTGIDATGGGPILVPNNLGFGLTGGQSYYGGGGQVRVSQHMDDTWELRQLVVAQTADGQVTFDPVPVGNNPLPDLFGPVDSLNSASLAAFAGTFVDSVPTLASNKLHHIRGTFAAETLSGESALGGDALNDYASRGKNNDYLQKQIQGAIDANHLNDGCPSDDPLTADSILRRATMDSCAGCHAPAQMLGPERKIGCGMTWPESLGETHIDESGNLSPALKDVFLPHRANVVTAFLQACDEAAINDAFAPPPSAGSTTKSAKFNATIGGRSTH
ncbi:MAG: hypothetical protein U0441_29410 [Polyangiaceae bacterium]